MAKKQSASVEQEHEVTVSEAMEIIRANEIRKQKKREALKAWRKEHKSEYNEYIKQWRAKQRAKVEAAEAILAAHEAKQQ